MVDLIDDHHFDFMENVNEEGKQRDGPLVFPEYSSQEIPFWDYRVYNNIIVTFFLSTQIVIIENCLQQ